MTHLDALNIRLANERNYLARAKTELERNLRKVWIDQIEREIASEIAFCGKGDDVEMTDDEILAELMA